MMRIAITGGIGSGKSHVCQLLEARGIKVYDCDEAAKRLMRTDLQLQADLQRLVGEGVYINKVLQKPVLARFLLASEANKQAVNGVVHPAVARDFMQSGCQWLESAILFESGFDRRVPFDVYVGVTAPTEVRLNRVMQRDNLSHERAMAWIDSQMPQQDMAQRCHYVIENDGHHDLNKQINGLFNYLNIKAKMETILSIAGKPGLYRLVSRGKMNLIVETIDEAHRRIPAFSSDRVTSLGDIAMYTDAEDIALWEVLAKVGEKEEQKPCSLNYKKCTSQELRAYFAEVLPNFDQDRVHDSDIKKLLQWYNILVNNGYTDFKSLLAPTEGDNVDDSKDAE